MVITAIEPLNQKKCKVFLDEDFAFVLYKRELRKYQIEEGAELSQSDYQEILGTVLTKRAKERIMFLLQSADKTEMELRQKLKNGYYPSEIIDQAIAFVQSYHYIDDDLYAKRYIERNKNKRSKLQMSSDLRQKGIESETIQLLLEECPVDEESQICKLLQKKGFSGGDMEAAKQEKIAMSLARRGFPYDKIKKAMEAICDLED